MKRIAIVAFLAGVLTLGGSGVVLAHNHHAHAGSHRKHHHHHARILRISDPTPSSTEGAATVMSFEGGVLTLKLTDGSIQTGKVTSDTEINCGTPEAVAKSSEDGGRDQGNSTGGGSDEGAPTSGPSSHEDDNNQSDEDNDDENEATEITEMTEMTEKPPACGEAALKPGAIVHSAELRIDSRGKTFTEIELAG
jgi:hypothetical protein